MIVCVRASLGSPGFGEFLGPRLQVRDDRRRLLDPIRARIALASAKVVGSGTVGPDAMAEGSSPGTSEISSVTTLAGAAAAASRPPLMADKCLRTQFISSMRAPSAAGLG